MSDKPSPKPLKIEEDKELKDELGFKEIEEDNISSSEIDKRADAHIDKLLDDSINNQSKRRAVDEMGLNTQVKITNLSKMLDTPIKDMAKAGDTGGPVAKSLVDLKQQVEALDPAKFDLSSAPGFLESIGKFIPFIGNRISRYFTKYMSAEEVINRVINSLELGKDQLKRDNITLGEDKERMVDSMDRLVKTIQLGKIIDQKLQFKLDNEINPDSDQYSFIQNDLLFPLRQRILDLQQTLNVSQQGILTIEIIIRNNRELMRGVNRALNVTISALQIAVATALALNNQKIVLSKIKALNDTTNTLIANNAKNLKTQGAKIHKDASDAMLDIKTLEQSFADIKMALDDISKFRKESLPRLSENINRMESLNDEAIKTVKNLEKGNAAQGDIIIDLDNDDYEVVD